VTTTSARNSQPVSRSKIEALVIELNIISQIAKSHVFDMSNVPDGPPCMNSGLQSDE
jgi:hypothetical protein